MNCKISLFIFFMLIFTHQFPVYFSKTYPKIVISFGSFHNSPCFMNGKCLVMEQVSSSLALWMEVFFEGCWFLDGSFPFSEKQQGIRFSVGNIQRLLMLTRWTNTRNTAVFMSHDLHYGLFRQIRCLLIHHFQSRLMTVDFLTTLAVVSRS